MLFFESEGEFFPFGEEGGALGSEGFEFGGVFLGLLGGGEVAEAGFDGGDGGFEAGISASAWRRRSSTSKSATLTMTSCIYLGSWRVTSPLNKIKKMIERRWRVEQLDVAIGPAHVDSF